MLQEEKMTFYEKSISFSGHSSDVEAGLFPDRRYVLTGSHDNTGKLWCTQTGSQVHTLQGHTYGRLFDFLIVQVRRFVLGY